MKIRLSGSPETVALWASFISALIVVSAKNTTIVLVMCVYIDVEDIEAEKEAGRRIASPITYIIGSYPIVTHGVSFFFKISNEMILHSLIAS